MKTSGKVKGAPVARGGKPEAGIDVVFGFDMETDIGSFTPYYEGVKHGTPRILEILEKHGAASTFFWTGDAALKNRAMVRRVARAGHETGCHGLYHETLGDPIFPLPNNFPVLPSEVAGRISEATRVVAGVCGAQPVSFRCPRLWGSTRVVQALEQLGYVADASLPLYYYNKQTAPYHPSRNDWTARGTMKLLEIPNFCDLAMKSRDTYGRDRDQWPLFRTRSASYLAKAIDSFIETVRARGERPVLCFYFHPWEFHAMPQGGMAFGEVSVKPKAFITKRCGAYACDQLDKLCALLTARGARFITCKELANEY